MGRHEYVRARVCVCVHYMLADIKQYFMSIHFEYHI